LPLAEALCAQNVIIIKICNYADDRNTVATTGNWSKTFPVH